MKPTELRAAIAASPSRVVETTFFGELVPITYEPVETFHPAGRSRVMRLEDALRALPQVDLELEHFFCDGIYVRRIYIPAGCALVGYIHMQSCITTVVKGDIAIYDGEGPAKVFKAPHTMSCAPGTKKAGYAVTDVIWQDAYANPDNLTDIDALEHRLTADTHEQYLQRRQHLLEVK